MHSDDGASLPPDDVREWIDNNAPELRAGLANPKTRARLLELLLGEQRQRGDGNGIRTIAVLVAAVVGGLVIFVAAVLTMAVVQQRQPPYRI